MMTSQETFSREYRLEVVPLSVRFRRVSPSDPYLEVSMLRADRTGQVFPLQYQAGMNVEELYGGLTANATDWLAPTLRRQDVKDRFSQLYQQFLEEYKASQEQTPPETKPSE